MSLNSRKLVYTKKKQVTCDAHKVMLPIPTVKHGDTTVPVAKYAAAKARRGEIGASLLTVGATDDVDKVTTPY